MTTARQVTSTILIAVTVAALLTGAWFGYWALAKRSVANQYDINTNTQQYQAGLISQERDRVTAYDTATDDAQKNNIKTTFCAVYAELTKPPADLASAHDRIC
jgi:Tfp pilus assembly protein PilX